MSVFIQEIIIKYWLNWVLGLITLLISVGAKHYIKLQKKVLEDEFKKKAEQYKNDGIKEIEAEIKEVKEESDHNDKEMEAELEAVSIGLENLTVGVLSIQGKQFREMCIDLLAPEHVITIQEYEQFEEDYIAYKDLGGNHRGDALHDRVVKKFDEQTSVIVNGK